MRVERCAENPLDGQVALVTGGSAGIGLATALELARLGASVVLVGRSISRIERAGKVIEDENSGARVLPLALDVSSEEDMTAMTQRTLARFGRIDILVCAAGVLRVRPGVHTTADTSLDEWNRILNTNLTGTFLSNRAVLPVMLRQRSGLIVNLSSLSGRRGYAFDAAYCASKFALIGMTESLADELRPRGVRACVVLPGAIDTGMWNQNGGIPRPAYLLPASRVAGLIAFLAGLPADTQCPEFAIEPAPANPPLPWSQRGCGEQVHLEREEGRP